MIDPDTFEQLTLAFKSHSFFFGLAGKIYDKCMAAYDRGDRVEVNRLQIQFDLLDRRFKHDVERHKELCARIIKS